MTGFEPCNHAAAGQTVVFRKIVGGAAITQRGIILIDVDSTGTLCHGFDGFPFCSFGAGGRSFLGVNECCCKRVAQTHCVYLRC
jgi:hypothetical protein